MADKTAGEQTTFSQFACIGAGFSGIGLGATLKRWYNITDIRIFEREPALGGTWFLNRYPGCACDVPSAFFSFSFETNPDWSHILPPSPEIWTYLERVARKYDLIQRMTFNAQVERCEWIEESARWRVHARDRVSGAALPPHECQFLFSAAGILVQPRGLDVPGASNFRGPVFHTARWRHDVDLTGKDVVIFGNGCSAAQVVPAIVGRTRRLTQVIRTKHWITPHVDKAVAFGRFMSWLSRWFPWTAQLQRFMIFADGEKDFYAFLLTPGSTRFRQKCMEKLRAYMRREAPAKYHDMLIPDFELGCKRRIADAGYLESLHAENLTLTDAPVREIVPDGVRMTDGSLLPADVIVLANGFATNSFFAGMEIVGRDGQTVEDHFKKLGGPGAYNCTVLSGFPNFFVLLGPNAAQGHTSTIFASENSINYSLRILKPILEGRASIAEVRPEPERAYVEKVQGDLKKTVFHTGCASWYLRDSEKGRERAWNGSTYPYFQLHFWWRSLFPIWKDWQFRGPAGKRTLPRSAPCAPWRLVVLFAAATALLTTLLQRSGQLPSLQSWFVSSRAG